MGYFNPADVEEAELWKLFDMTQRNSWHPILGSMSLEQLNEWFIITFPSAFSRPKDDKEWLRRWIKIYENYP